MAQLKNVDGALNLSRQTRAGGLAAIGLILGSCSGVILNAGVQASHAANPRAAGLNFVLGLAGLFFAGEQFVKAAKVFKRSSELPSSSQESGHGLTR